MAEHTNLDLQLVQRYIRYMELCEEMLTGFTRTVPEWGLELRRAMDGLSPETIYMLERVTYLTSGPGGRYEHKDELGMAISLWMLQRPGPVPEPEPPSGHIDRYTGHEIPDVKQTDAQFTEDDLEEFACRMAAEAEERGDYDEIPY